MEETVFKVVAADGQRLISVAQKRHQITYIPQVWIKPKIGKIFVFKSLVDARYFIKRFLTWNNDFYQVWKALGINVLQMDFVACASHITSFWDGHFPNKKFPKILRMVPPEGTLVVDEIKLLKKVT